MCTGDIKMNIKKAITWNGKQLLLVNKKDYDDYLGIPNNTHIRQIYTSSEHYIIRLSQAPNYKHLKDNHYELIQSKKPKKPRKKYIALINKKEMDNILKIPDCQMLNYHLYPDLYSVKNGQINEIEYYDETKSELNLHDNELYYGLKITEKSQHRIMEVNV